MTYPLEMYSKFAQYTVNEILLRSYVISKKPATSSSNKILYFLGQMLHHE